MGADHNTLDALRRMAKDRATTPAEKATARRLAKALAAKIGKRPRRSRRKGNGPALPEPPAARWRRVWVVWLEAALDRIAIAGWWLHVAWIVSIIVLVLMFVTPSDSMRQQAGGFYLVRTLVLVAAALIMMISGGLFAFAAWWLKTWRSERLRPALLFLSQGVPWLAMMAASMGLIMYLENRLRWPSLVATAAACVVPFAIIAPWYRLAHPTIVRVLTQASHGALRAGVAVLAIALSILATGGVWAYVNPRLVPTPPEFEVPAPAVAAAHLAMLRYKIAALDCYISRIDIERDVMGLPECATLPETPRKRRNKPEERLRDEARRQRCQRLMADLELVSTCGRPDIAAYATRLSAEIRRGDR